MKLSKDTVTLLKNYAQINGNLLIKPGSKLTTISSSKSVYSEAVVTETFDTEFGIYDLNEFLGALALFNDPEIVFDEKSAKISEGKNKIKYFSADVSVLTVPTKEIKLPPSDVEFTLTADQLNMVMKTASVLRATDVSFIGDGKTITVQVGDRKNVTGNTYDLDLGTTDTSFKAYLKVENFKFLPGDYTVELSSRRIAKFSNGDLQYVIALEPDSTFE